LIGKNSENFYIVSEKLDETTVEIFNWDITNVDRIKTVILQLSKILEILYDKLNFNHRDLKPDNVMYKIIDGKINIRLIDFGYSCLKYRNLIVGAISRDIYISSLHYNPSKIRDMHAYLYFITKYITPFKKNNNFNYNRRIKSKSCPLFNLFSVLIMTDDPSPFEWKNTYKKFDVDNSQVSKNAAFNCSYDVIYNIFKSLTFNTKDACSNIINTDWTKYLVTLCKYAYAFLSDEEYNNIKPEIRKEFINKFDFELLKNIPVQIIDNLLRPDIDTLNVNSGAISFILFYIIMKNNKEYNDRLDAFLAKINVESLHFIKYNNSSFHISKYNKHEEKTYILKYPNVKSELSAKSFIDYSPIDSAMHYNNGYVIKKLIQYDLTVNKLMFLFNISYLDDEEVITLLLNKYKDLFMFINEFNWEHECKPLTFAVKQNNLLVVKKFVDIPNIQISAYNDKNQLTCLHWASIKASILNGKEKETALEIIKVLLKKYPALADIKDNDDKGPANPYYAKSPDVRTLIKNHKSWLFKKNPNTEKNNRSTMWGGKRKTKKHRRYS
jgi:serine/threonine protein kinase